MNTKDLFDHVRTPDAPPELRERVLSQTNAILNSPPKTTWPDRIWENKSLRYACISTMVILFFTCIFWDPPFPGENFASVEVSSAVVDSPELVATKFSRLQYSLHVVTDRRLPPLKGEDL